MDHRKQKNNTGKNPHVAYRAETIRPSPTKIPSNMSTNEQENYQVIQTGQHFGRYIIHGELGRGGMGIVYKAFDQKFQRFVALKVMLEKDRNEIKRFMREAAIMTQLDHPNIVRLYDFGDAPQSYLTMEYIDGFTLEDLIRAKKVPPKFLLQVLIKVCEALSHAHRQKVLHRDIKPSNIMMTRQGEPKVMDFGLAKVSTDKSQSMSIPGGFVGTVLYMSREQLDGNPSQQSDIYSLGVTMYEALTYQTPYQGDSFHEICFQIIRNDPIPPRRMNPSISPYFEAVCLKCLDKKPQRRYQNFKQLARELRNLQSNQPIIAKKYTAWNFFVSLAKRYKTTFISLATIISILCCSLVMVIHYSIDADRARVRAEKQSIDADRARVKAEKQKNQIRRSLNKVMSALDRSLQKHKVLQNDKEFAQLFSKIFQDVEEFGEDENWSFLKAYVSSQSGDLQKGMQYYNEQLQTNPQDPKGYNNRGILYCNLKQYKKAVQDFNAAIKINPKNSETYNNRGLAYKELKDYTRAIQDFNTAIAINPKNFEIYYNRGLVYKDIKDYTRAFTDFDKVIKINSQYGKAYENRALVYENFKNYEKALQDANAAIQLRPNSETAYNTRGIIYQALKNYSLALRDYNKALQLKPTFWYAYYCRGDLYRNWQQFDKAFADYSQVIKLNDDYMQAYSNRGNIYYMSQKYQEAISDYSQAIRLEPNFANAYAGRALVYCNLKKYKEAEADFNKALQINPRFFIVYMNRGLVYLSLEKYKPAIKDFQSATAISPNWKSHKGLYQCYQALGKYKKAQYHLRKMQQLKNK
ncbi:serine/threonine-protein kinase [Candidatus Uabimicrobium amorphum]|uniref:non-specific serine/threonine protein kinase n=1 Tax=Uabimicrobium amorphum TaxID=2596890 RepID=A0A5S9IQ15_UABAM|nr:serine/threonine-protein kinase [Candidatus Uabimicrobium amorphum]BBM85794.1 hypothetical protein UABAM_04172 [Candidatus Uabimicrobium amorphum]